MERNYTPKIKVGEGDSVVVNNSNGTISVYSNPFGDVDCCHEYHKNGAPSHFYDSMGDHEWFGEHGESLAYTTINTEGKCVVRITDFRG